MSGTSGLGHRLHDWQTSPLPLCLLLVHSFIWLIVVHSSVNIEMNPLISYPQLTGQGCLDWEILVKAAIQEEKDASLPGAMDLCV